MEQASGTNWTLRLARCEDVLRDLPDKSFDAIITDPPYNAKMDYGDGVDDARSWPDYCEWLSGILTECERVTDGPVFCFVSVRGMIELVAAKPPLHVCVWNKPMAFTPRYGGLPFLPHWEPCLIYGSMRGTDKRLPDWTLPDVWSHNTVRSNGHPCPKPPSLMLQLVSAIPAQRIFDPFAGSATTGVACIERRRDFLGIESEQKYFDLAVKRLRDAEMQMPLALNF